MQNLNIKLPVEKLLKIKDPAKYFIKIAKQFKCLVFNKPSK
jgi:hypothetical protein